MSGSPSVGEPAFLEMGKILRSHGVHGEVLLKVNSDYPEHLQPRLKVYLGENHLPFTIRQVRPHNSGLIIALDGIHDPETAQHYQNNILYISTKILPKLGRNEYYYHQLMDMEVMEEDGKPLGKLTEIIKTGANDVYVVTSGNGKELLLPAIKEVIIDIDLTKKIMHVHLLNGLRPDQE